MFLLLWRLWPRCQRRCSLVPIAHLVSPWQHQYHPSSTTGSCFVRWQDGADRKLWKHFHQTQNQIRSALTEGYWLLDACHLRMWRWEQLDHHRCIRPMSIAGLVSKKMTCTVIGLSPSPFRIFLTTFAEFQCLWALHIVGWHIDSVLVRWFC